MTHDLGRDCDTCEANEARCAFVGGCCHACSHFSWAKPARETPKMPVLPSAPRLGCESANAVTCRLHNGRHPWAVLCMDCYGLTGAHGLLSTALAEHAFNHGKRVHLPRPERAA